jgi:hypothetical protein
VSQHSLEKPSFVTASILFGVWGGALAVTQALPPLFWLGIIICFGSALFTIWRYYEPVLASVSGKTDALPRWEGGAVSLLVLVEIVGALYLAVPELSSDAHRLQARFQPPHETLARIARRPPLRPIERHIQPEAPKIVASLSPPPAALVVLPPKPHSPSQPTDKLAPSAPPPSPPQAQPLPHADTDPFMKVLRDWYVRTQKDVPAEIVNGTAWEPEEWINQQLEDYERPWRVKVNGADYVATPISLSVPSAEAITTYNQGNAVAHHFPETVRHAFLQVLVPPKKLGLIFVYTDQNLYFREPQLPWEDRAEEIKSLFPKNGGGWKIDSMQIFRVHPLFGIGSKGNGYLEDNYSGWVIQMHDPENPTDDEKAIVAGFKAANIQLQIASEPETQNDVFGIAFGKKKSP